MGISREIADFITNTVTTRLIKSGVTFESVLELGSQSIKGDLVKDFSTVEQFYASIAITTYMYIDANSNGEHLRDLNQRDLCWKLQRSNSFKSWYDLVTNLGTGEHIFDQMALFKTIHMMCRPSGMMIHAVPLAKSKMWSEHAFYTYSENIFLGLVAANQYVDVMKTVTSNGLLLVSMSRPNKDRLFKVPYDLRYIQTKKVPGYDGQDEPKPMIDVV